MKMNVNQNQIFLGEQEIIANNEPVSGSYIEMEGEEFYRIDNFDKMKPFFVNVVSGYDHWIYLSSKGGLSAGRKNPDNSLFPYYTDDVIHDAGEITGNKTIVKISQNNRIYLWEPFSDRCDGVYLLTRNLYKNIPGTKIIFEEINHSLQVSFKYSWTTSEAFGFVKESELSNLNDSVRNVEVLDGIQNLLPAGVYQKIQNEFSTLVDGYKKNELIKEAGIGVYTLSSLPRDVAEPAESLAATLVWSAGIETKKYLLSSVQLENFRRNLVLNEEKSVKGIKGSYFLNAEFELSAKSEKKWYTIAEINQDMKDLIAIKNHVKNSEITTLICADVEKSKEQLIKIVAKADGIQITGKKTQSSRHFANTLFNLMRGGIFDDAYQIDKEDFVQFIKTSNPFILEAHKKFIGSLAAKLTHSVLIKSVKELNDRHFSKLVYEYLPLTFSRRHGDPSRPWNLFSIDIKDKLGDKILNYQGNWRDIFQNWEALALSYPKFLESMISKFLNASTADGYNPYRLTRDGFDWEVVEPDNPWANIGYWGDHQIIYLQKLLELSNSYNVGSLKSFLTDNIFSYANVPYRIKSYEEILSNPFETIEFDHELDTVIKNDVEKYGGDSRYKKYKDHTLVQVNLTEKLILAALTKLSNFIPGGGIWLNTQRPEWNDANNALVGNGISMVTLYYLRRYMIFIKDLLNSAEQKKFVLSKEVAKFFSSLNDILKILSEASVEGMSGKNRKSFVDRLGKAGSDYRDTIYEKGFSGKKKDFSAEIFSEFCSNALQTIDATIAVNKRDDSLFQSYNIINISDDEITVSNLYEMLEGQVAVLSSGYLDTEQTIKLLNSLRQSKLYRKDQHSYILYPEKELPLFSEKNNISAELVNSSPLLTKLMENDKNEIIYQDQEGNYHWRKDIINAGVLKEKLDELNCLRTDPFNEAEVDKVLAIYEAIFSHKEFTGRANTFYKYEGLGSIYWHMVSKLLLAVQENYKLAESGNESFEKQKTLKEIYYDIKEGIGVNKSPEVYGAFPTDPYSHTPSFAGVQQPGMTGQVKEDFISRMRELGIYVKDGKISVEPSLISPEEFLVNNTDAIYYNTNNRVNKIKVERYSFLFTYCQTPVVIHKSDKNRIEIVKEDGSEISIDSLELDEATSQSIFNREGAVSSINIYVDAKEII